MTELNRNSKNRKLFARSYLVPIGIHYSLLQPTYSQMSHPINPMEPSAKLPKRALAKICIKQKGQVNKQAQLVGGEKRHPLHGVE